MNESTGTTDTTGVTDAPEGAAPPRTARPETAAPEGADAGTVHGRDAGRGRADRGTSGEVPTPPRSRVGQRIRWRRPDRFSLLLRLAIVVSSALLGFVLVAQVRAVEDFDQRLATEREEDLTRLLADLTDESDALSRQIIERRLLLYEFDANSEQEQLAVDSLEERLADLRVLAGTVEVVGDEGVRLTVADPLEQVTQDQFVDAIQELRDAGAEAIAVNGVRLVAQSGITTRNGRLVLDGQPIDPPYRIEAIGPSRALSQGLAIPGGVESSLGAREGVEVRIETLGQVRIPARGEPVPFVYAEPVPEDGPTG